MLRLPPSYETARKTRETSTRSQDAMTPVLLTEKVLGPPNLFESFDPSRLGLDIPNPLCMRKGEKTVDPAEDTES